MATEVKVGSFAKATGVGLQSVAGFGFEPKCLVLWTVGATVSGTWSGTLRVAYGLTAGPSQSGSIGFSTDDEDIAPDPVRYTRHGANALVICSPADGSILAVADLSTFGADGFTLNWTTNDGTAPLVNYFAIGGAGISASLVAWNSPVVTGTQAVTGVGFTPQAVIHLYRNSTVAVNPQGGGYLGLGMTDGTTEACWSQFGTGNSTATTRRQRLDKVIHRQGIFIGSTEAAADHVSFNADGFTVDWTTIYPSAGIIYTLALNGITNVKVESWPKATGEVDVSQAINNVGFRPKGLLLTSYQSIVNPTEGENRLRAGLGATDGTNQVCALFQNLGQGEGGTEFNDADVYHRTNKLFAVLNSDNHPGEGGAVVFAEGALSACGFTTEGYDVDWSPNMIEGTQFFYLAVGPGPPLAGCPDGGVVRIINGRLTGTPFIG